jgi:DNA-binding MarR family transcriptional regulator
MPIQHADLLQALWRAAHVSRTRIGAVAEEGGVTFQQYMVLRVLGDASDEGLPTLEIASRMVERAPAITGLVDRLERQGLVRRQRVESDRRQIRCVLTEQGRELVSRLDAGVAEASAHAIGMLTGHEVGVLRHLLGRMGRGNG